MNSRDNIPQLSQPNTGTPARVLRALHCGTCRFWSVQDAEDSDILNPIDWDAYIDGASEADARLPQPYPVGYCMHPRLLFFERPATGPEWGCIQHEPGTYVPESEDA